MSVCRLHASLVWTRLNVYNDPFFRTQCQLVRFYFVSERAVMLGLRRVGILNGNEMGRCAAVITA